MSPRWVYWTGDKQLLSIDSLSRHRLLSTQYDLSLFKIDDNGTKHFHVLGYHYL